MASTKLVKFTDQDFASAVLASDVPVLVDFWATWCGPCRAIAPIVDQLADELDGQVKVGKLDVDDNRVTATTYSVQSIPTLLVFKGGRVVDRVVGAVPKARLLAVLERHVTARSSAG
jgi:thioredoxin 1